MKCSIIGCKSNAKSNSLPVKIYYRFPLEDPLRSKWIAATRRPNYSPPKTAVVCEDHFLPWEMRKVGPYKRLMLNAVPSINIGNAEKHGKDSVILSIEVPSSCHEEILGL